MISRRTRLVLGIVLGVILGGYLLLAGLFYAGQSQIVYAPSHQPTDKSLTPWQVDGKLFGYTREASAAPQAVWLVMQGNGGQAGPRGYFKHVPPSESLFILEYPGYGAREGPPTREAVNAAASSAYRELRRRFPGVAVGVVGESFGAGPATSLTREPTPPDSVVLIVPVARLDLVISRFIRFLPVRLLLHENWDNPANLRDYRGPVTIYAAEKDQVISREDTLLLAASAPRAQLIWIPDDHYNAGGRMDAVIKLVR